LSTRVTANREWENSRTYGEPKRHQKTVRKRGEETPRS